MLLQSSPWLWGALNQIYYMTDESGMLVTLIHKWKKI